MRLFTTFSSLYVATFFMLFGSGLLTTYLSLNVAEMGGSELMVSGMTAAYYFGMVAGAKLGHILIARVGHIRSYTAASGITAAIVLLMAIIPVMEFWLLGRFVIGLVMMCQYMVLESWLNDQAEPHQRGVVFGLYMAATYFGMMLGQLVLVYFDATDIKIPMIIAICFSFCLVPLAVTRAIHPTPLKAASLEIMFFIRKLPQALVITLAAGMMTGSFYAMMPLFSSKVGLSSHQTGIFMAVNIGAALFVQWPLAWLSDNFNRIKLIFIIAISIALVSSYIVLSGKFTPLEDQGNTILIFCIITTGLQFMIYPLAVAVANDNVENEHRVSLSAILLVVFGIGSAIGPLLAGSLMQQDIRPQTLYRYLIYVSIAVVLLNLIKASRYAAKDPDEISPHVMMPDTASPIGAAALNPNINEDDLKEKMGYEEATEIKEALLAEIEEAQLEREKTHVQRYALVPIDQNYTYTQFILTHGKPEEDDDDGLRYH